MISKNPFLRLKINLKVTGKEDLGRYKDKYSFQRSKEVSSCRRLMRMKLSILIQKIT